MIVDGRVLCEVPGCRRTRVPDPRFGEQQWFVCSKHWALTDKKLRRVFFRCRRLGRIGLEIHIGRWLIAQAIERAHGI